MKVVRAIVVIVGLLIIAGVVQGLTKPTTTVTPAATSGSVQAGLAAPAATARQPVVGDKVTSGNWAYVVTKVERPKGLTYSTYTTPAPALGQWLVISMTLTNVGKQNYPINTFDFQVVDGSGTKYDPSSKLEAYMFVSSVNLTSLGSQFPPGIDVKTALVFDINPAASGLKLLLKQTDGTAIALD